MNTSITTFDVLVKTQLLSSAATGNDDGELPLPNHQEAQESRHEARRSAAPELAAMSFINPHYHPLIPH